MSRMNTRIFERPTQVKKSFRRSLFAQMDKHWQKVANKHLPEGVALDVKVTNVNLAGDVRYNFQMGQSIRLVKTIYWPSIEFEYTLREGNKVIKTDTIKLKDMAFMDRGGSLTRSSTPYFYEKRLITDWFKKDVKAMLTQWQKYNTAEMT